jgi:hypothetical protein
VTTQRLRRQTSYVDAFAEHLRSNAYDILLEDGSFFVFRADKNQKTSLSYAFFPCPYEVMGYWDIERTYQEQATGGSPFEEFQQQFDAEQLLREFPPYLRYDWSPSLYQVGVHPHGHIHVGHRSEVRLALDYVITPFPFILFAVRQNYPSKWAENILPFADLKVGDRLRKVPVDRSSLTEKDLWEYRLL